MRIHGNYLKWYHVKQVVATEMPMESPCLGPIGKDWGSNWVICHFHNSRRLNFACITHNCPHLWEIKII